METMMESEEYKELLDIDSSIMSSERVKFIAEKLEGVDIPSKDHYIVMLTKFSEEYSKEILPGELLGYDLKTKSEVMEMVELGGYMAKEFSETETLTAKNLKDKEYEITRVDEVNINAGPRAGQKAVVIELDKELTYWPNKTSITTLAKKFGTSSDKWMGQKIKIFVEKMMVRNERREVLFAEPAKK